MLFLFYYDIITNSHKKYKQGVKYYEKKDNIANKYLNNLKPQTLDNVDARKWYLHQESKIEILINKNDSLKEQAKQAFNLRNYFRTKARKLMKDKKLAQHLITKEPNLTWEQVISKTLAKGHTGESLYIEIIKSSQRSRTSVNQMLL